MHRLVILPLGILRRWRRSPRRSAPAAKEVLQDVAEDAGVLAQAANGVVEPVLSERDIDPDPVAPLAELLEPSGHRHPVEDLEFKTSRRNPVLDEPGLQGIDDLRVVGGDGRVAPAVEDCPDSTAEILANLRGPGEGDLLGFEVDSLTDPAVEAWPPESLDVGEGAPESGLQDHPCVFAGLPAFSVESDGLVCIARALHVDPQEVAMLSGLRGEMEQVLTGQLPLDAEAEMGELQRDIAVEGAFAEQIVELAVGVADRSCFSCGLDMFSKDVESYREAARVQALDDIERLGGAFTRDIGPGEGMGGPLRQKGQAPGKYRVE